MIIGLLLLTYGQPLFASEIKKILNNHHNNFTFKLYIHPKYKDDIDDNFKQYIINNLINTSWGDMSLVEASVNLLKSAFDECDYFFLLSGDTYVFNNHDMFKNDITNDVNEDTLSMFDFMKNHDGLYKSSQWWGLNKHDANIIIKTQYKYKYYFVNKTIKTLMKGAYDEYYFLTVLMKEVKNYKYINKKIIYVKWLQNTITKHPFTFNKITNVDIENINISGSYFIRKCTLNFNNYLYKLLENINDTLLIIYIGSETNQNTIINYLSEIKNIDLAIITSIDVDKLHKKIFDNCYYIIPIIWKFYNNAMLDICDDLLFKQWKQIIFIPEKYTFENMLYDDKKCKIINSKKIFIPMYDDKNNKAYIVLT